MVWSTPESRNSLSSVQDLLIDAPGGKHVRLGDVAEVRVRSTSPSIEHQDISRFVDVTANVSGRSVGSVADDVKDRARARSSSRSSTTPSCSSDFSSSSRMRTAGCMALRPRRGDRHLPAPAGRVRQLAPGASSASSPCRWHSPAGWWRRGSTAAPRRWPRSPGCWRCWPLDAAQHRDAARPVSATADAPPVVPAGRTSSPEGARECVTPVVHDRGDQRRRAAAGRRLRRDRRARDLIEPMAIVILGGLRHLDARQPVRPAGAGTCGSALDKNPSHLDFRTDRHRDRTRAGDRQRGRELSTRGDDDVSSTHSRPMDRRAVSWPACRWRPAASSGDEPDAERAGRRWSRSPAPIWPR